MGYDKIIYIAFDWGQLESQLKLLVEYKFGNFPPQSNNMCWSAGVCVCVCMSQWTKNNTKREKGQHNLGFLNKNFSN